MSRQYNKLIFGLRLNWNKINRVKCKSTCHVIKFELYSSVLNMFELYSNILDGKYRYNNKVCHLISHKCCLSVETDNYRVNTNEFYSVCINRVRSCTKLLGYM